MVTVAVLCGPSTVPAGPGLDSVTVKVRGPSTIVLPIVVTVMTWLATPGPNASVPPFAT